MWVWECESILSKSRGVGSLDDSKWFDRSLDMNWHAELISIIFFILLHSHWRSIPCACNAMLMALRSGHQSHFNLFAFYFSCNALIAWILDPLQAKHSVISFVPSSKGLFIWQSALQGSSTSPWTFLLEQQRYKDTVGYVTICMEVPGHHYIIWLTP